MSSKNFLNRGRPPSIFTLVVVASISVLSMNMLLPALPSMTEYFKTDYSVMQLTVTGYLAMTGLLQIFFGPLSDRFGRRPVILAGLCIFVLASIICMIAPNIEIFLLGRILQTSSATGIVLSRAIVRDLYSTEKAASMLGYVTVGMMVVPMFSPLVGGLLDQYFGWQAIFAAMIAFGGMCLVVVYLDLGETNVHKSNSFMEQIGSYPELLKSRRFWGYTLTASFTSGAYFSLLGGGPFVATEHFHLNPTEFGSFFLFIATGYLLGNFASGRFSTRMGINKMMVLGGMVSCIGLSGSIIIILIGHASAASFFGFMFFVGIGNGLTLPNANAGMVSIRPKLAGSASGLGGAVMVGGGSIMAAYVTSILTIESGPLPLVAFMLGTSIIALLNTCYVIFVEASSTNKID
ncbi:multidrug effflux MFS transporter [Lentilitoribacter sp. Alg239-R112]|uniref:multidrug effflux MFS transporter n=1 Tax=Lentilitoribacter sp. Alg239-R112 TaxID=2305987 RepID=UPI0013A6B1B7|nr:multidrug effflux MFS transporter [Lentilitoribacter sp. Alg239-R112]